MKLCVQFFLALGALLCVSAEPEVNTKFGPIRGLWFKTARANEIAGFLGLPYAEPPVGELRFENPRSWSKKWTEIRNATSDGSMCMQMSENGVIGNEDCLYLNVFTSTISKNQNETSQKKFAVMVFIHGGAFNTGNSNSSLFAPTYLLDHEIVLVTLNYRLNTLGFFSTGNDVTPGNYALKDITAALIWIRDNIEAFGGDSKSVTLIGHSSGAASVQLLASSKATEGLFHKLITMSGSATGPWTFHDREAIRKLSMNLATQLGCDGKMNDILIVDDPGSGDDENITTTTTTGNIINENIEEEVEDVAKEFDKKIMECMKKADATDIVKLGYFYVWRRNPVCIFGPTLEAEADGAILTVHPARSLSEGLFRDMPWITGVVADEGLLKTTDLFLNSDIKSELIKDYQDLLVPYVLEMENAIDNYTAVTEAIENFYFNGDFVNNLDSNITQMIGDGLITWFSYDFLQKQIEKMKSNVYFYLFSYEGTFSTTFRWDIPFRLGTSHGDDLNYIFPYLNVKYDDLQLFNTMSDRTMINIMCEMWVNFAKTGKPSARLTSSWEPYQLHRKFMRFGSARSTDRSMENEFFPERMNFWSEIMSNYSKPIKEYRVGDGIENQNDSKGAASRVDHCIFWTFCTMIAWLWTNFFY